MALLTVQDLSFTFGGQSLLNGVNMIVEPGERICLIGRNGSGKTTFLKLLFGEHIPTGGSIGISQELRLAYLSQESALPLDGAEENDGVRTGDGAWNLERYLSMLGMERKVQTGITLSGGELRRFQLASALSEDVEILLLDEPTNHLDLDTIFWLERHLKESPQRRGEAIIFVTHDRAFARNLATRVIEIDRGNLLSFPGGYDSFIARRDGYLAAEEVRNREFDRKLQQEEAWLRRGIKARRTRNEGRVRRLMEMRREYEERRNRDGIAALAIGEARRSGDLVVQAEEVTFSWGEIPLIDSFSGEIQRGDKIGIVGPNGSGKTTLLRILLGELVPQKGMVRIGAALEPVYFDQLRQNVDPEESLFDALGEGSDTIEVQGKVRHVSAYLKAFLFREDDFRKPVKILSGGEQNRLLLARLFARRSNLLILDEPTNDLDGETLELLEELLVEYRGTILLVSHDRDFLDNVVTASFVFTGNGRVESWVGGFSDWSDRIATSGEKRAAPQKVTPPKREGEEERPRLRKKKLSFREERELRELPTRITNLEAERDALHRRLSDPEIYRSREINHAELVRVLQEKEREIEIAYFRWEALEDSNPS